MAPPGGGPTARQGERKQSMPHNQRQNAQNALNVSMRQGATIQPNHEMNEKRGGVGPVSTKKVHTKTKPCVQLRPSF